LSKVQTESSHLGAKIRLRLNNLPENKDTLRVLDVFSANGKIWNEIKRLSSRDIKVLRMDIRADLEGIYLLGDNMKFLETMDLSAYDIIDVDAYGIPFEQLRVILPKAKGKKIFVTFIQSLLGTCPYDLLNFVGIPHGMIQKCPTLFGKKAWGIFKQYLAQNGVVTINHYAFGRKHYLAFTA